MKFRLTFNGIYLHGKNEKCNFATVYHLLTREELQNSRLKRLLTKKLT